MSINKDILAQKNTLKEEYQKLADQYNEAAKQSAAFATRFAMMRLVYFFAAIGLIIFIFSKSVLWAVVVGLVLLLAFGFMIRYHLQIQAKTNFLKSLEQVNNIELSIINRKMDGLEDGNKFLDPLHPYALDLDLFGPYSFFHFFNRGKTALGQKAFADYLLVPANTETILKRQASIKELSRNSEWRQEYLALGLQQKNNDEDLKLLTTWLNSENYVKPVSWIPIVFYITPLIFIAGIYLCMFSGILPLPAILVFWLVPMLILRKFVIRINETHRQTSKAGDVLKSYGNLMKSIEDEKFQSGHLIHLQKFLKKEEIPASGIVKKLGYIISQLEVRNNAFAIMLNVIGLWDLYWVYRLEIWKSNFKSDVQPWFDAFGEFEALVSFGGLQYNQMHWVFPSILEQGTFDSKELKHPLIEQDVVIGNDVKIPASAHLKLLTGSNMAGKSTFLRTVGLNIVMGLAGLPVAADDMQLPQLDVFTSMRTQDALHESTSSFYAELKRLKMILEAVEKHNTTGSGKQPFFLLDEILKGTNSVDRHTGSKALIEQLISEKAAGIIATHDLDLGQLEEKSGGAIENLCIEVDVEDGKLVFDYKLKKGVSKSFNATQLMREMGIKNL